MIKDANIILIDDNIDDCEAVVRAFSASGSKMPIKWFNATEDALDHLLTEKVILPTLLILDLNLPGMDGRSFLKHIKSSKNLLHIPVIVMTTSLDKKDVFYCYEHGISSYIQKPVSFERLKEICNAILHYWFDVCSVPDLEA